MQKQNSWYPVDCLMIPDLTWTEQGTGMSELISTSHRTQQCRWPHLHHRVSPVHVVPEVLAEHRVAVAAEAGPRLLWPRHGVRPRVPEESVGVSAQSPETVVSPGQVGGHHSQPSNSIIKSLLNKTGFIPTNTRDKTTSSATVACREPSEIWFSVLMIILKFNIIERTILKSNLTLRVYKSWYNPPLSQSCYLLFRPENRPQTWHIFVRTCQRRTSLSSGHTDLTASASRTWPQPRWRPAGDTWPRTPPRSGKCSCWRRSRCSYKACTRYPNVRRTTWAPEYT